MNATDRRQTDGRRHIAKNHLMPFKSDINTDQQMCTAVAVFSENCNPVNVKTKQVGPLSQAIRTAKIELRKVCI